MSAGEPRPAGHLLIQGGQRLADPCRDGHSGPLPRERTRDPREQGAGRIIGLAEPVGGHVQERDRLAGKAQREQFTLVHGQLRLPAPADPCPPVCLPGPVVSRAIGARGRVGHAGGGMAERQHPQRYPDELLGGALPALLESGEVNRQPRWSPPLRDALFG